MKSRKSSRYRLALVALCLFSLARVTPAWIPVFAVAQPAGQPEKYALLVGVTKYNHSAMNKAQLEFPEVDAKAMAEVFRNSGYAVDLLLGTAATQKAIREKLDGFNRRGNSDGVVVIGLFGHGTEPEGTKIAYYCPYDTTLKVIKDKQGRVVPGNDGKDQLQEDPSSLIAMPELLEALKVSPAGNRVLLADCCRNDPNRPRGRAFGSQLKASDIPENTAAFFACSAGQQAYEHKDWGHGAFTKCLLDEIDTLSATGKVGMAALAAKVPDNVENLVALRSGSRDRQKPYPLVFGNIDLQLSRRGPGLLIAPFDSNQARAGQAAWARHLNVQRNFTNQSGVEMVLIAPGEFRRGSSEADIEFALKADSILKAEHLADEQPQHRVRITKPFYMAKFETTQGQVQKLLGRNTSYFSASGVGKAKVSGLTTTQFPAEAVSWFDCIEFCNKLSEAEGKSLCYALSDLERNNDQSIKQATVRIVNGTGYRLPTEAEWEYACRAGTTTAFHFGNLLNGEQANVNGNYPFGTAKKIPVAYLERTSKVGEYAANQFGLFDMCGNVFEWCQDGFDESAYVEFSSRIAVDPTKDTDVQYRVLRGGSWNYYCGSTRSAIRSRITPGVRGIYVGFRVVCMCGPRT